MSDPHTAVDLDDPVPAEESWTAHGTVGTLSCTVDHGGAPCPGFPFVPASVASQPCPSCGGSCFDCEDLSVAVAPV